MGSNPNNSAQTKVITIDGPAGSGKSTVAKNLAKALGYSYLDTGAMYRALTYKALSQGVALDDEKRLIELAKNTEIDLEGTIEDVRVLLDGADVSEQIRSIEVTNHTSAVASKPGVRDVMVGWQRDIGRRRNIVIEGRDTGTIVFPDATHKFYVDASLAERARRRLEELKEKGTFIEEEELIKQIRERDHKDMNRAVGPLKKADDAIVIDTTGLTAQQTAAHILQRIHKNA